MILHRVIEHVKAQNWTAVGLDFVIVVIGVLFAFQITSWNDEWEENKRKDEALAALLGESAEDVAYLEAMVSEFDEYINQQRASIEALIAGELPAGMSQEAFVAGVTVTRRFAPPTPPRSVYDSLVATGDIRLIDNAAVMKSLAQYYADVAATQEFATRISNGVAILKGDYHPAIISYYDPSSPDLRRQDADFQILAADDEFIEDSVDMLRNVVVVQNERRALLDVARATYTTLCAAAPAICEKNSPSLSSIE